MFSLVLGELRASAVTALVLAGSLVFLSYILCLVYYRVFLHPLCRFPGPKLAAATLWYEFYYDVVLGGRYIFEIERMHERYGAYGFDIVDCSSPVTNQA